MPTHELHRRMCRLLLGKPYDHIHKILDSPAIFGKRGHRRYFHDMPTVLAIMSKDFEAGKAAFLHITLDELEKWLKDVPAGKRRGG